MECVCVCVSERDWRTECDYVCEMQLPEAGKDFLPFLDREYMTAPYFAEKVHEANVSVSKAICLEFRDCLWHKGMNKWYIT